jgi:hypothetical protein
MSRNTGVTRTRGTNEYALRRDGWILRNDLRQQLPDLDDREFADLMLNMEGDGLAEFKLVDEMAWMRVTHLGMSTADKWNDALARAH